MKKIFFSAMALAMPLFACAEDIITIAPIQTTANSGWDGTDVSWDNMASILLKHEESKPICSVQFDVYFPQNINAELAQGEIMPQHKVGKNWVYDHTFSVTEHPELAPAGYACYRVLIYDDKMTEFLTPDEADGSEELASFGYATDADATDGFSGIYIKGVVVSYFDAGGVQQKENYLDSYSYVKIGSPVNGNLVFAGALSSDVNEALATETGLTSLDLSAVTAVNGDFTYVAGRNVVRPTADVTANVKYVAPLAGTYSSFCAPVDVTTPCYTLTSCDGTTAVFGEATVAPAGQPVLIKQAVNSTAASATLASVTAQDITSGYYVAHDGSGMHSVKSTATIPALRGYWPLSGSSNLRIAIETPTGIQYIGTADEVFGNTYDLQGRQVQEAHNGVFVVNGKKQFVK